ncbi:putative hydrolases of the HAD superfamily, partial [Candidatus Regiella insecticola 5.15]
ISRSFIPSPKAMQFSSECPSFSATRANAFPFDTPAPITSKQFGNEKQTLTRSPQRALISFSNGARVHNTAGELLFSDNIDQDIVTALYSIEANNPEILTNIYRNDDWYINRESPEQAAFFHESIFNYQIATLKLLPTDGVCKIYFLSHDHEKLLPLEKRD